MTSRFYYEAELLLDKILDDMWRDFFASNSIENNIDDFRKMLASLPKEKRRKYMEDVLGDLL